MVDHIDSLDEKWYVEIWIFRYYLFGIEIHTRRKELVKHVHNR